MTKKATIYQKFHNHWLLEDLIEFFRIYFDIYLNLKKYIFIFNLEKINDNKIMNKFTKSEKK